MSEKGQPWFMGEKVEADLDFQAGLETAREAMRHGSEASVAYLMEQYVTDAEFEQRLIEAGAPENLVPHIVRTVPAEKRFGFFDSEPQDIAIAPGGDSQPEV